MPDETTDLPVRMQTEADTWSAEEPERALWLEAKAEIERLRAALQRLADCDWVITPGDRMDAVRKIARDALGGYSS